MIEGNDIILFANDWDGDPLSKKHIALRLARANRVLWVNSTGNRNPKATVRDLRRAWSKLRQFLQGCRQVADNISVFSPLVIPFHGNRFARWLNRRFLVWSLRRAAGRLGFRAPITWTFVPSSGEVAGALGERLVIYHCVDEYTKFTGTNEAAIAAMEQGLMEKADLVVVSSARLYETKRASNAKTVLVTHGVDAGHFGKACLAETVIPEDCARLPRPVIGFFGLIADWVDLGVVRHLAFTHPEWSLLLIGEQQSDVAGLRQLPNVHLTGRRPYEALPGYCRGFDVAILPFVENELTRAANPLKLREYLAAGLPVVATPLPEVARLGALVRVARTPAEFAASIEGLLAEGRRGPDAAVARRMAGESWDGKMEELSGIIAGLAGYQRGQAERRAGRRAAGQEVPCSSE